MTFSAITNKIGRLAAGTAAAITLTVGMIVPAHAMSATAATPQLHQSPQVAQVAEFGFGFGSRWGHHRHHSFFPSSFGLGLNDFSDNSTNIDNSVHNCQSNTPIVNNGGIVINQGGNNNC